MKPIIKVENLSKEYFTGAREAPYSTLRESFVKAAKAPFRRLSGQGRKQRAGKIWALRDVSFEVMPGEVVGIIGRNGAGKSTLLKILSRITDPTTGLIELYGRVGSLLEVGTGFHPELTGRENIYLNGAILGMRRDEITRKFDEIVAFAEVEKFLDTPVKRYSSGMYMRLAFAVAAHLEPEILVVDEVLAVGDAVFQAKCISKMRDVASAGRTILYISHNMVSVAALCQRAMLLSSGSLIMDGETTKVIAHYFSNYTTSTSVAAWETPADAPGSEAVRLKSVRVLDRDGQPRESFHIDEPVYVEISYWMLRTGLEVNAGFHLYNSQGALIFAVADFSDPEWRDVTKEEGVYRSLCCINESFLNEGGYTLNVAVSLNASSAATEVFVEDVVSFDVQDHGGSRARGKYVGQWNIGAVRPVLDWKTVKLKGHNNGTDSQ